MYSHEIQALITDGMMSRTDFLDNVNPSKSPQISRIHYDSFSDYYTVNTKDNYNLHFKIKKEA